MKLDDLYFDVIFNDKTKTALDKIKTKIKGLNANITVNAKINSASIKESLNKISGQKNMAFKINNLMLSNDAKKALQQSLDSRTWILRNVTLDTKSFETRLENAVARAINRGISGGGSGSGGGSSIENPNRFGTLAKYINYIRGFFLSGVAASFIKKLTDTIGIFEQQLVALRSMLMSDVKGNTLFNQIKEFSVRSPFKFSDLVGFTKQLTAFQVPYNEIFDTTKRLADLSAGLGVDMSRIILAYGQVRSASYLRGQELRQFTEAGVPILQMLADKFSILEKRMVSVGDVFDYVSKRKVPFEMVKQVIQDMTNEGGIFYNMQEKQADTLRGKITNLSDAYDILLYNLGRSGASNVIGGFVDLLMYLMKSKDLIISLGAAISAAFAAYTIVAFTKNINRLISSLKKANLLVGGWASAIMGAVAGIGMAIWNAYKEEEELLKNIDTFTKETSKNIRTLKEELGNINVKVTASGVDKIKTITAAVDKLNDLMPNGASNEYLARIMGAKGLDESIKSLKQIGGELNKIDVALNAINNAKFSPNRRSMFNIFKEDVPNQIKDYIDDLNNVIAEESMVGIGKSSYAKQNNLYKSKKDLEDAITMLVSDLTPVLDNAIGNMDISTAGKNELINKIVESWATGNEAFAGKGGRIAKIKLQLAFNADAQEFAAQSTELTSYFIDLAKEASTKAGREFGDILYDYAYGNKAQKDKATKELASVFTNASKEGVRQLGMFGDEFDKLRQYFINNPLDIRIRATMGMVDVNQSTYLQTYLQRAFEKQFGKASYYTADPALVNKLKRSEQYKYIEELIKEEGDAADAYDKLNNERNKLVTSLKRAKEANIQTAVSDYKKQIEYIDNAMALMGWKYEAKGGNKPSKTDEALKAEKERYSLLKKYIQEYEKLVKLYGEEEAKKRVSKEMQFSMLKSSGFAKSVGGILNPSNAAELLKKYSEYISKNVGGTDDRKKFAEEVAIEAENRRIDDEYKKVSDEIEALRKAIEQNTNKWNTYNKLMGVTGDKTLSSQLAFGRTNAYGSQSEELKEKIGGLIGKGILETLKGMQTNKLTEKYGQKVATMVTKYFDLVETENQKLLDEFVNALEKSISEDTTIQGINAKYAKLIQYAKDNNLSEEYIAAFQNQQAEEISKTKWNFFKKNPKYAMLFEDLDRISSKSLSDLYETLVDLGPSIEDDTASFKELITQIKKVRDELEMRNPFKTLSNSARAINMLGSMKFDDKGNHALTETEAKLLGRKTGDIVNKNDVPSLRTSAMKSFENAVKGISQSFEDLKSVLDPLVQMFENLGIEGISDIFSAVSDSINAMNNTMNGMSGLANLASGMGANGLAAGLTKASPFVSAAMGVVSIASSIFAMHDKALQKRIEQLQRENKKAEAIYDLIEKRISSTLSRGYGYDEKRGLSIGTTYRSQRENLLGQLANKQQQLDLERQKKKRDDSAIADLEEEILNLQEDIMQYSKDLASELFSLDLQGWAQQIGDALIDAFANGESAAEAFNTTVSDILKNVVKNMAQLYILEPAMKELEQYLFGSDGKGGVFGEDLVFSQEDLMGMIPILSKLKDSIGNVKDLYDAINEVAKQSGIDLGGTTSGLSGGIKSITEDTADLLASYINAIRARLMLQGALLDEKIPLLQEISESQLRELQKITINTMRNAEAAERIETALSSVTTVGSSGKELRVKVY